jgi:transcription elongation GreA/GreB family factor
MSVAFMREESAETAAELMLPDRPISRHPNPVTAFGLISLEEAMARARTVYDAVQKIEDANERRRAAASAFRDMRYFAERLRSAQLVPSATRSAVVAFGNRVTFSRDDGRRQMFGIVGEDEANPRNGSISYVFPIGRALIGKSVGEAVVGGDHEVEVLNIE